MMRPAVMVLPLVLCVWVASAERHLHSHCFGRETVMEDTQPGKTETLMKFGGWRTRLRILCMLEEVRPSLVAAQNPSCYRQTNPPYTLFIEAIHEDGVAEEWHLESLLGGSVEQLVYSTTRKAEFFLRFRNDHQECNYTVAWVVNYCEECDGGSDVQHTLPAVIEMTPSSIFLGERITFTFKQEVKPGAGDTAKVIPFNPGQQGNEDPCKHHEKGHHLAPDRNGSQSQEIHTSPNGYSYFTHVFNQTGLYYLCYSPEGSNTYQEVAQVMAFGGDPDFYTYNYDRAAGVFVFHFYGE
eukprot:Sspe_Gene.36500::Locus_17634_Transcript_1_1_Confidence_1.000_Length_1655::g.36500::m.36500